MLKIILISICLISLVNSQKWTADLGEQYPGITPLFSQLNDSITITSILQDDNRLFHLLVHRYSINGKLKSKCDLPIPTISKRIWDLKIQQTSDFSLALSWLYNDGAELGVRVLRVNVTRCNFRDARVPLYGDLDLVLYVPYYLVSRDDSGLYLFVKSADICEGICRFEIANDGEIFTRDGTFVTARDESLVWQILPVNSSDSSSGYYYIREEEPQKRLAKIEKLNSSGTLLRALATSHNASANNFAVSSSHARLSACSTPSGCFLLDPRTFESTALNASRSVATMLNTKDNGVLLIDEDGTAMKFRSDASLASSATVLDDFDPEGKCFKRKTYQVVEFDDEVYCAARPCMRKRNATDALYQVAVTIECFRNPAEARKLNYTMLD